MYIDVYLYFSKAIEYFWGVMEYIFLVTGIVDFKGVTGVAYRSYKSSIHLRSHSTSAKKIDTLTNWILTFNTNTQINN